MINWENSLLSQVGRAKGETERTSEEEQRRIASMEAATNLKITTYNGITIPAGFASTKIVGESTLEEGLVITDSKSTTIYLGKMGTSPKFSTGIFVW